MVGAAKTPDELVAQARRGPAQAELQVEAQARHGAGARHRSRLLVRAVVTAWRSGGVRAAATRRSISVDGGLEGGVVASDRVGHRPVAVGQVAGLLVGAVAHRDDEVPGAADLIEGPRHAEAGEAVPARRP